MAQPTPPGKKATPVDVTAALNPSGKAGALSTGQKVIIMVHSDAEAQALSAGTVYQMPNGEHFIR